MGDGVFAPWHIIIVAILFVVLFGYKKLPDATRSLGRSMRIFKSEVKGLHDDEPKQVEKGNAQATATPVAVTPVTATPVAPAQQTPADAAEARPAQVPGGAESDRS